MFAMEIAKLPQAIDEGLALIDITAIENSEHNDFLSVDVFRKKWQRWCLAHHNPDIQFFRRGFHELAIAGEDLFGLPKWKDQKPGQDFRTYRMQSKFELRYDSEIPAATPN